MTATPRATLFALAAASLSFANSAFAQDAPAAEPAAKPAAEAPEKPAAKADAPKPRSETATLGAGCFWSTEAVFEHVKGVKSVTSGFAGGNVPRPTYEMVCTGQTGHAEVVQVVFDPNVISYEKLLKVFWSAHDPTTRNSQGDDFGPQYRSVIFYQSEAQKETAKDVYRQLTERHAFRGPIVTELAPLNHFYPAEPYHQNYFRNNKYSHYSEFYIGPKLHKLKLVK